MYFYEIGDYVLASDEAAESIQVAEGSEYKCLKYKSSATVSVIEPGDEYEPYND